MGEKQFSFHKSMHMTSTFYLFYLFHISKQWFDIYVSHNAIDFLFNNGGWLKSGSKHCEFNTSFTIYLGQYYIFQVTIITYRYKPMHLLSFFVDHLNTNLYIASWKLRLEHRLCCHWVSECQWLTTYCKLLYLRAICAHRLIL